MSSFLRIMFFSHETDPPAFFRMVNELEGALMQLGTIVHQVKTKGDWQAEFRTDLTAQDVFEHLVSLQSLNGTLHVAIFSRRMRPAHEKHKPATGGASPA